MKPFPILVAVVTLCASVGVISWMSQPRVTDEPIAGENEAVSQNPFEIPESGPHPTAVLEEETYDFGKMILGETEEHAFVIRNEGDAPLTLRKGFSTCKCTVPTVAEGEIPPGESVEVVLNWEPESAAESFEQHAVIWTNDPEQEELTLQITGEVRDLIHVDPPLPWTIGTVNEQEGTTFEGRILSGEDSFNILNLESTQNWLGADVQPLTADELAAIGPGNGSGYRVTGTVRPEMTVGRFEETLTIRTDLGEGYVVEARVVGTRPGPFSIIGPSWQGSEMTVRMGDVDAAQGKSVTVSLLARRGEEPIAIESVRAEPDLVEVSLVRDELFKTPVREKYDLTFTIPPASRRGLFRDDDRIAVTLRTNRATMEEIHLSVDATIE